MDEQLCTKSPTQQTSSNVTPVAIQIQSTPVDETVSQELVCFGTVQKKQPLDRQNAARLRGNINIKSALCLQMLTVKACR